MSRLVEQSPHELGARLAARGRRRAYLVLDPTTRKHVPSDADAEELAHFLAGGHRDCREHDAIFFEMGRESGAMFGAFLHRTLRGQGQGGVRNGPYARLEDFLHDGLRLSLGMTRKNALAGLWWGGAKGVIAPAPGAPVDDADWRRLLYREFGAFVTSLRGCFVAGQDAGTTPEDMAQIFATTRFATCTPRDVGGCGEPAPYTAAGVVCAIEAALEFLDRGSIAGATFAVQGTGSVGSALMRMLIEQGARRIVASEITAARREALMDTFAGDPVDVRLVAPEDHSILAEPCDVLVPAALGGVLGPKTIPSVRAQVVCGPANNQLVNDERDGADLAGRGVTWVPDFVANRMGIVTCSNEQYGSPDPDPAILRHLDRESPEGIYATTIRILERVRATGTPPVVAANALADDLAREPHPIWAGRTRSILDSLVAERWHER